jgi:hypothetical protein
LCKSGGSEIAMSGHHLVTTPVGASADYAFGGFIYYGDDARTLAALKGIVGKRLTYRQPHVTAAE